MSEKSKGQHQSTPRPDRRHRGDALIAKRTTGLMQPQMKTAIEKATRKQFPQVFPLTAPGRAALHVRGPGDHGSRHPLRSPAGVEGYRTSATKLWKRSPLRADEHRGAPAASPRATASSRSPGPLDPRRPASPAVGRARTSRLTASTSPRSRSTSSSGTILRLVPRALQSPCCSRQRLARGEAWHATHAGLEVLRRRCACGTR